MDGDVQNTREYYSSGSKSGSLTMSCVLAVLATISLVVTPYIGFFVFLAFITLAVGFWRRYLTGLSTNQSANDIVRVD